MADLLADQNVPNLRHLVSLWFSLHATEQKRLPQRTQEYVPHSPHTLQNLRAGYTDGSASIDFIILSESSMRSRSFTFRMLEPVEFRFDTIAGPNKEERNDMKDERKKINRDDESNSNRSV